MKNLRNILGCQTNGKYSALDIAKYVVNKCVEDGHPISNLELQKILYYIQLHFLQKDNTALFREDIEAWQYGPVVPIVYNRYYVFAAADLYEMDETTIKLGEKEQQAIDSIVNDKRAMKPWDLVEATHTKGKAWDRIYRDGIGNHKVIPKGVIAQYG